VLYVGGQLVTDPGFVREDPDLVKLGRLGADVRNAAFLRYTEPHDRDDGADLDLGASDCREGAARVAHKLIRELNWPGPQVAELMADAEYTDLKPAAGIRSAGHGPMMNKSLVHRLVHEAEDRKWVSEIPRDRAWNRDPTSASPGTRTLTLLSPGSPARFTAESWAVPLYDMYPRPSPATLPENSLDLELALAALRLLPFAVLVIPHGAIFATPARRALVIGEAWAANMTVVHEGLELAPAASIGDSPATLGTAALSAARFHRALRVHDRATVCVDHLCDLSVALREAEEAHLDAFGSSALTGAQAVAALLDRAIPTPSRTGAWSRSTARAQPRKRPPGTQPM
jgi:hypothetical protein